MICDLRDAKLSNLGPLGSLADDLLWLSTSGIRTLETIIAPVTSFDEWQQQGVIHETDVERALACIRPDAMASSKLIIRVSLRQLYYGLFDRIVVAPNFSALRSALERIYRSWGSEQARASRVVRGIADEISKPVLIIQPFIEKIYSVITRNSLTGAFTTSADYRENINNRLYEFSDDVSNLISSCDSILGRPVKILFTNDENFRQLAVVSVSDETMTTDGRWRALADLLRHGLIEETQFVTAITPDMIGFTRGLEFDPHSTPCYVKGLPASPGITTGRTVFPDTVAALKHKPIVFLAEEGSPEDIHMLSEAAAAVGLRGGMTSHLAVVSRGIGIPAVTRCGGRLNPKNRTYEMPNGQLVPEFMNALVDGTNGFVGFSDHPMTQPKWIRGEHSNELAATLLSILNRITPVKFKGLAIEAQFHIAELRIRLREMGFLLD